MGLKNSYQVLGNFDMKFLEISLPIYLDIRYVQPCKPSQGLFDKQSNLGALYLINRCLYRP